MKILFIGDIVARLGRDTLAKVLPQVIKENEVDLVIANVENLAHGKGATKKTLGEISLLGVNVFTGGNHIFWNKDLLEHINDFSLARPSNYVNAPGVGYVEADLGAKGRVLVINMVGMAFMPNPMTLNPFIHIENLLQDIKDQNYKAVIVDFHAEASSEKVLMGHMLNGQVTALVGTHWHIPTADTRILDGRTAYVSDVGMVGAQDESLGVDKELAMNRYISPLPSKNEWVEEGVGMFNSVLIEVESTGMKAKSIVRIDKWGIKV